LRGSGHFSTPSASCSAPSSRSIPGAKASAPASPGRGGSMKSSTRSNLHHSCRVKPFIEIFHLFAHVKALMHLTLLKSKIHRAAVSGASLNYEGSMTISADLAKSVGLLPYERILVSNMKNGER